MNGTRVFGAFAIGVCCCASVRTASAETLFSMSGQLGLLDGATPEGTKVKLQLDLDRNGDLDSFETLTAVTGADGSYQLTYDLDPTDVDLEFVQFAAELVADYNARGFEALLDDGPLPVLLTVEREGYSSVVKRLTSMFESPSFDFTLVPLRDVHCVDQACMSGDGAVRISGFPGGTGIGRAYASAYDPTEDKGRFPGLFTDNSLNLLISSGFSEINLYDDTGKAIHAVTSPLAVRFEAKRASWKTLPDLEMNSGRIELPMYSFDQTTGEWVREGDGELQRADGSAVSEAELTEIHAETFADDVYVSFSTSHFSSFNCDAPISERACVKGRLVSSVGAEALAGVEVSVEGVSYTGTAGTVFTGLDGYFAVDVMKSELAGEDVDGNGKNGETFTANVTAKALAGIYIGTAFDNPTGVGSVESGTSQSCRPDTCDCFDLGDIVVDFEPPRLCEISVHGTFSGTTVVGDSGPLAKGDAVVGASVYGQLSGVTLPQSAVTAICDGATCSPGELDSTGSATFAVAVAGDAPQIKVDSDWTIEDSDGLHYYSASTVIAGCAPGETAVSASVELKLDHAALGDLGSFIDALGSGPAVSGSGGGSGNPISAINDQDPPATQGCGCRTAGGAGGGGGFATLLAVALGLTLRARRRLSA